MSECLLSDRTAVGQPSHILHIWVMWPSHIFFRSRSTWITHNDCLLYHPCHHLGSKLPRCHGDKMLIPQHLLTPGPCPFLSPFILIGRKALKAVTVCLVLQSVNLSLSDLPRWRACSGDARGPCSVLSREGGCRNPGPARPHASPTRKNGKT